MVQRKELLLVISCISVELVKCIPMAGLSIPIDKHEMKNYNLIQGHNNSCM